MEVVFATCTAWLSPEMMVVQGESYPLDDVAELWRKFPDAFVDDKGEVPGQERVETATAAPGEMRRGPGRPRNL